MPDYFSCLHATLLHRKDKRTGLSSSTLVLQAAEDASKLYERYRSSRTLIRSSFLVKRCQPGVAPRKRSNRTDARVVLEGSSEVRPEDGSRRFQRACTNSSIFLPSIVSRLSASRSSTRHRNVQATWFVLRLTCAAKGHPITLSAALNLKQLTRAPSCEFLTIEAHGQSCSLPMFCLHLLIAVGEENLIFKTPLPCGCIQL